MKRFILTNLILGTVFMLSAQVDCEHQIFLFDDGLDGWSGAYVDVYVDGSSVLTGITLLSGMSHDWFSFNAYTGADIDVYYTAGSFAEETSYEVYDVNLTLLGASGSGGAVPGNAINLIGNCAPPPDCCYHTIILADDYGDGWNNGSIDVYVDGSPVTTGLTMYTGAGPDYFYFTACSGASIDIFYTAGWWPYENYFALYDGYGTRLGESGLGGATPASLTGLTANCPPLPPECCNHTITLMDDYGDGWNGGYLDVFVSGSPVLSGITLSSGAGPGSFIFNACSGATIDVYYHAGGWPYENAFQVYDGDGTMIGESGAGGSEPADIRGLTAYCTPPPPGCCDHTIHLTDDAGDGWDGGFIDVHVDGAPVLTGITLPLGASYDWFSFSACTGSDIDVYYTIGTGGYAYENSYIVTDAYLAVLGESGQSGATPGNLIDLVGNCDPVLPPDPECCSHQICLTDDYGDGWNGGMVDVYVDGSPALSNITLLSGTGPECFMFNACTGSDIDVYYSAGGWAYENHYVVYDGDGTIISESGAGGGAPANLYNLPGACSPAQAECCDHILHLTDDAGDGWDGGFIDVHVDGSPVLTGITMLSGYVYDWFSFSACTGSDIDVFYTIGTGGYAYENSYAVTDGNYALLGESGQSGSTPGDLIDLVGNCDPAIPPDPECCSHQICLTDDYGDGWNGGTVDVYVDGLQVLNNITLYSGFGPECFMFNACFESDIDVYYSAGSWAYENYYAVYDGDGTIIGESGAGGSEPTDLYDLPGYCEPVIVPENDLCGNALPLDCNTSVDGTTIGASFDDLGFCGTSNTAPGVWYSFVASSSLSNLSTCNQANFDTKISVFSGTCNDLICVDGRDDTQGCAGFTTSLDVPTTPGETYFVLVHGFASGTGDFTLTLTCPCQIIVPPQPPFEHMTANTLSVADATDFVGWTCNNPGWQITSPANLPTIEYTAGIGSADFTATYDNGTSIWTCRVTVTSIPATEFCTMTQGFYGNAGGVYCDGETTTEELLTDLLSSGLVIAGPANDLTLTPDDAGCLINRLPSTGPSIPISTSSTCGNPAGINLHKKPPKRFKNTLVGQTITLGLNLELNDLGNMVMTSSFLTTATSSGCGEHTAQNHPVNSEWRYNEIPKNVYNYLGTDPSIYNLYELANDALEGHPVGGLPLEDITKALEAINDGFDGCMFGTFDGGYWPDTQLQEAPYTDGDDPGEVNEIEHIIYPNPFNETAIIEFTLPISSNAKVEVYSTSGVLLETLMDRYLEAQLTTSIGFSAKNLSPGMYVYVIHTKYGSFFGKMIKGE